VTESGIFGVHQFYGTQRDSEASAQVTMTLLTEYLNAMGVSRELLTVASLTPSKQMGVLTWLTDKTQTLSFSGCFSIRKHKTRLAAFGILLLRGHGEFRVRFAT